MPVPILSKKHTGMRISANGLLGRLRDGEKINKSLRFSLGELLENLNEVSARYYAGETEVVDEFLQLYCLDKTRPVIPE